MPQTVQILFSMENNMNDKQLKPYMVSYVNANYEDLHDKLVLLQSEPHAIKVVLEKYEDSKFVFNSKAVTKTPRTEAA